MCYLLFICNYLWKQFIYKQSEQKLFQIKSYTNFCSVRLNIWGSLIKNCVKNHYHYHYPVTGKSSSLNFRIKNFHTVVILDIKYKNVEKKKLNFFLPVSALTLASYT